MKRKIISQRAARRTGKALRDLEQQVIALKRSFTSTYPGVHLRTIAIGDECKAILNTARRLGFPLAAKIEGNMLELYAVTVS